MNKTTNISEAKRYITNAREILKTKAGLSIPGFYADKKYVKMASHTAWCGVVVAMDTILPPQPKGTRKTVDTYKKFLATRNRKTLTEFVSAYNYLHLYCGYDGELNKNAAQTGLKLAENIIDWCGKN